MPTRRLPFHIEFPDYPTRMVVIAAHTRLWARMTDRLGWQLVDPGPETVSQTARPGVWNWDAPDGDQMGRRLPGV